MDQVLIRAIEQKAVIELHYHGYARTVEPHAYGVDADGIGKLRAFQTAGGSESNERQGWKIFNVGEIASIRMTASLFVSARPNYKRGDEAMQRIYAQV